MRRNRLLFFLFVVVAVARPEPSGGATLVVPDAFATVTAALGAALAGDTVLVRSGTYLERVTLVDGVVLLGESGTTRPCLDGGFGGAVVTASNCGSATRVVNFALRHGAGGTFGGGASLQNADVVFEDCELRDNLATNGGGLGATGSDFTLLRCVFDANLASQSGGGIATTGISAPSIDGCTLQSNSAVAGGSIAVLNGAAPSITHCLMRTNTADQGAAIWWDFFTAGGVQSSTIVESACLSASTGALHLNPFASPVITACIVAFTSGAAATFTPGGATPTWGCNDAFGNSGGDTFAGGTDLGTNIVLDPLFCDGTSGNWTLTGGSPCLAGGGCPNRGAFDVGCSAVAAPETFVELTWGRAKSAFR
jgi:predicted outer membrane repeat protein